MVADPLNSLMDQHRTMGRVPTLAAGGGREHAGERGEELVVGGVERQVHLPADGVAFLLHLHVLGGAAAARPAARGAQGRPPDQRPLAAAASPAARRAVVEERQRRRRRRRLLERFRESSLPGARSARVMVRRGAAQLVLGEVALLLLLLLLVDRHVGGTARARRRQPKLQLHAATVFLLCWQSCELWDSDALCFLVETRALAAAPARRGESLGFGCDGCWRSWAGISRCSSHI
jgi:hypothetical protein